MNGRVAAVDFGSNTVGFLVAERHEQGLKTVERRSRFTRLSERLAATGRLGDDAIRRTLEWVQTIERKIRDLGASRLRAVGTEALRQAANTADLARPVEALLTAPLEILSGTEEARLTFAGVRAGYPDGPLAVLDIGGGSSEISLGGAPGSREVSAVSLPLGAVLLTEQAGEDWPRLTEQVARVLETWEPPPALQELPEELTVLGGNGASLAMMDRGHTELVDERVEGHTLSRARGAKLRRHAAALTPEQRTARLGVPRRRADILLAGLAILEGVAARLGMPGIRCSRYSLRHGVVCSMLQGGQG